NVLTPTMRMVWGLPPGISFAAVPNPAPQPPSRIPSLPLLARSLGSGYNAEMRLRRFTELVSSIVNSLARQGQLLLTGPTDYTLNPPTVPIPSGPTGTFPSARAFLTQITLDQGITTGVVFNQIEQSDLPPAVLDAEIWGGGGTSLGANARSGSV